MHSKITTSDLAGFFFADFDGERPNFNRNMVKQMVENGQKISDGDYAAGITSLVPGVKNSRLWNGLGFDRPK